MVPKKTNTARSALAEGRNELARIGGLLLVDFLCARRYYLCKIGGKKFKKTMRSHEKAAAAAAKKSKSQNERSREGGEEEESQKEFKDFKTGSTSVTFQSKLCRKQVD